jgi:TonB family protein
MDALRSGAYHGRPMFDSSPAMDLRSWRASAACAALLLGLGCASGQSSPPRAANAPVGEAVPAAAPDSAPAQPAAAAPAPSSKSSVDLLPTGTRDTRSKEEIQRVIAGNRDKVRACYDAALKNNPGIHGDLVVAFVINPDGSVKHAEVNWSESELHVPELDSCAIDALQTLKFPPSSRGLESKVNYPFNFNPGKP